MQRGAAAGAGRARRLAAGARDTVDGGHGAALAGARDREPVQGISEINYLHFILVQNLSFQIDLTCITLAPFPVFAVSI